MLLQLYINLIKNMEEKIELIWKEYHNKLLDFIQKRITDSVMSEDILQDVFVKILSKIHTLKDISKLQSWLYRITRNAITDHYRQKKKVSDIPEHISDIQFEGENKLMKEAEEWVKVLIKSLPDKYREAIELSEIKGISQKDIANQLHIPYPTIRSRVQRGRNMLKEKLTECCLLNVDAYGNILDVKPNLKNSYENC